MKITIMFLVFMYIIGCIWAFDYGHKALKNYGKVSPSEFILLIFLALLSWTTLFALVIGGYFKKRENEE